MSSPSATPSDVAVSGPLGTTGPFGRFANDLLAIELPDLPDERRTSTVAFVSRRVTEIPTPLRLGVIVVVAAVGLAQRLVSDERTTEFLRGTTLPLISELARMVRSLGFAFVWESWPDTSPTGAPP